MEVGSVTLLSGVTVKDEADISCSSAALCNIISLSNKPVCWINSSFNVRTVSSKLYGEREREKVSKRQR